MNQQMHSNRVAGEALDVSYPFKERNVWRMEPELDPNDLNQKCFQPPNGLGKKVSFELRGGGV